jgi:hypothetical protein
MDPVAKHHSQFAQSRRRGSSGVVNRVRSTQLEFDVNAICSLPAGKADAVRRLVPAKADQHGFRVLRLVRHRMPNAGRLLRAADQSRKPVDALANPAAVPPAIQYFVVHVSVVPRAVGRTAAIAGGLVRGLPDGGIPGIYSLGGLPAIL